MYSNNGLILCVLSNSLESTSELIGYNMKIIRSVIPVTKSMITSQLLNKMRLSDKDTKQLVLTMNVLLSNLLRNKPLKYSRNESLKVRRSKYNKRKISNVTLMKCINVASQHGYLCNMIGTWSADPTKRKPSYVVPTKQFFERVSTNTFKQRSLTKAARHEFIQSEQFVILRDSEKNEVNFKETEDTSKINKLVRDYNAMMNDHVVTDKDGFRLNTLTYRMFNEDFKHGGRLYRHGVLSLKNKNQYYERLKVKIDGKSVVEVDYNNLHPLLLALEEGLPFDFNEDLYMKCIPVEYRGRHDVGFIRKLVKTAFNSLLNAKDRLSGMRSITRHLNEINCKEFKAAQLAKWVYQAHPQFVKYFEMAESKGLALQYTDSEIAMHVVNKFVSLGKPILTVHDSFLVIKEDMSLLMDTMRDAVRVVCDKPYLNVSVNVEEFTDQYHCEKLVA